MLYIIHYPLAGFIVWSLCMVLSGVSWGFIFGELYMYNKVLKEKIELENTSHNNPILERNAKGNINSGSARDSPARAN